MYSPSSRISARSSPWIARRGASPGRSRRLVHADDLSRGPPVRARAGPARASRSRGLTRGSRNGRRGEEQQVRRTRSTRPSVDSRRARRRSSERTRALETSSERLRVATNRLPRKDVAPRVRHGAPRAKRASAAARSTRTTVTNRSNEDGRTRRVTADVTQTRTARPAKGRAALVARSRSNQDDEAGAAGRGATLALALTETLSRWPKRSPRRRSAPLHESASMPRLVPAVDDVLRSLDASCPCV